MICILASGINNWEENLKNKNKENKLHNNEFQHKLVILHIHSSK